MCINCRIQEFSDRTGIPVEDVLHLQFKLEGETLSALSNKNTFDTVVLIPFTENRGRPVAEFTVPDSVKLHIEAHKVAQAKLAAERAWENEWHDNRKKRLGPKPPTAQDSMWSYLSDIGMRGIVHPSDIDGMNGRGVNVGFRAYIGPKAALDEDLVLFYVKDNQTEDYAQAEACAYMLSEVVGYNSVPYTFALGQFSFHEWAGGTKTAADSYGVPRNNDAKALLYWFDYLIANTDRHDRNYLVVTDHSPEQGMILAIDHGYAFSSGTEKYMAARATQIIPEYPWRHVSVSLLEDVLRQFPAMWDSNNTTPEAVMTRHKAALDQWRTDFAQLTLDFFGTGKSEKTGSVRARHSSPYKVVRLADMSEDDNSDSVGVELTDEPSEDYESEYSSEDSYESEGS